MFDSSRCASHGYEYRHILCVVTHLRARTFTCFYIDARVCSCKLTTSVYIRWGNYLLITEQHLATSSCFSLQFSSRILVILSQLLPHCIYEWTERKREIQKDRERKRKRGREGLGGNGEFNFRTTRNSLSFATASKNKLCSLLTPHSTHAITAG